MAKGARSRVKVGMAKVWISIVLMVLAPLIVFASMLLVQMGAVSVGFGLDVLTLKVAMWTSFVAVGFAVLSVGLSLGQPRQLAILSAVLVVCALITGLFVKQSRHLDVSGPLDVSTNRTDPPVVSRGNGPIQACDGVADVPGQVAIGVAANSLVENGFRATDVQMFQVRGVRQGFWFGLGHEAVIRIRPGRTDVRVVARYDRKDGGETCRLANQLIAGLQLSR